LGHFVFPCDRENHMWSSQFTFGADLGVYYTNVRP